MRYLRTKDEPTNANLRYLDALAQLWPDLSVEDFMGKIRGVIEVREMLPSAVLRHFRFPMLFIGDAAYSWSPARLRENAEALCVAIGDGLDRVEADISLKKGGEADLSDRPRTKGEEIRAAVRAFQERRGDTELAQLRTAVQSTNLIGRFEKLEHWLGRKRPSSPHRSIEYEIIAAVADIGRRADDFHHLRASFAFQGDDGSRTYD